MSQTEDGIYNYSSIMSLAYYQPGLNADMLVGGAWEIVKGTTSYAGNTANGMIYLAGATGFYSSGAQKAQFLFPQGKKIKKLGITLDNDGTIGDVPCDIDVYIQTTK